MVTSGTTGIWLCRGIGGGSLESATLHSTTVPTSEGLQGFHLWQFQVFNSGAEGMVVVLFWLDLWEIFFFALSGFEPRTSGSLFLHSTTVPQGLLGFTSDNFRYLTLVERDWWWYCSDWTCERFSFWPHQDLNPGTSGSLVLHSTNVPQVPQVFTSDNFSYLTLVQRDWWWYCSDWTCERFSFWRHLGLNPWALWISSPALYHCDHTDFLVFNSDNFRYLTLVQRDWWWYCSDWTCERFSFWPHWGLNPGPLDL